MQLATVVTASPLTVRLKGDDTGSVDVLAGPLAVPGDLAAGQRVAVEYLDRQYWFYGRKP